MRLFSLYYWIVMILAVSFIFVDILSSYSASLLMAVMMMPGILFAKVYGKDVLFKKSQVEIRHICYFVMIVMIIEFYSVIIVYYLLFKTHLNNAPRILLNPLFIWLIIGTLLLVESVIKSKLLRSETDEKYISFVSNRTTITIERETISYIESNDTEVVIKTISDEVFISKMKISQWENILDDRFLRVHRSFIINKKYICKIESDSIYLGSMAIPISRKYKPLIKNRL